MVPTMRRVDEGQGRASGGTGDRLLDILCYDELRAIAARIARGGRVPEHDATSLLHEALANWMHRSEARGTPDRDAVLAAMVLTIRNAAIDRARRRNRASEPSAIDPDILDKAPDPSLPPVDRETLQEVGAAVDALRARAPRAAVALELRFHGGLELDAVAQALGVSLAQAKRDIAAGKAFVKQRLSGDRGTGTE